MPVIIAKSVLTVLILMCGFVLRKLAGVPELTLLQHVAEVLPIALAYTIWFGGRRRAE